VRRAQWLSTRRLIEDPLTAVDTIVHPTAVLGPGVSLGEGVQIGPYAVLLGPLRVGDRVWIGSGTSIGAPPEITGARHNLAWTDDLEHAGVVIEDDVVIRELVVIHQGSRRPTTVGAGSWLLNRCYLAHDVQTGPGVTVSAGVSVGGHATIRAGANLGMNAVVHQGRSVGDRAMVGMGTAVTRDIPPFAKAYGVPLRLAGVNVVGLRRGGVSEASIAIVDTAYRRGDWDPTGPFMEPEVAAAFAWWAGLDQRRPPTPSDRLRP
jgi:UDP-N-acetylglucosamine acyltransferase